MGRQIQLFICPSMRTAIESEAQRIGATLVSSNAWGTDAIEFSTSFGTDTEEGRLWTEAADPTHYELLCRAAKKGAVYNRKSGLWVKRTSLEAFRAYRAARKKGLDELVEQNRKYAIEVLGGRIVKNEG
jgi:hypothetical protein